MPIEFIEQWMLAEDKFQLIMAGNNLNIISVAFINSEGWSFILDNNLRINLGTDLSDKTYQNLSLALKYIFEKNLTPSIIDLRYKNGAALNYGK
jgi:cell division septal protein FtsQ